MAATTWTRFVALVVFLGLGAFPLAAMSPEEMAALREGEMRKLSVPENPTPVPDHVLIDLADNPRDLAALHGRWVLLNFWATWCAPCRKEMPALDQLNRAMAGDDFTVILVAVGRNPPKMIEKFFADAGIETLETWRDPNQRFAAAMGVMGLPVTVLLDPEGREVARLQGDADWFGADAQAFLKAILNRPGD